MWPFLMRGFFLATLPNKPHLWGTGDIVVPCNKDHSVINCIKGAIGLWKPINLVSNREGDSFNLIEFTGIFRCEVILYPS